jgi:hypothetical protein
MSDERGTSDDSTRFTARPGASDETRFTGAPSPPPTGGGPSHTTFPPGSLIGHTYRIEALLARGGMGEVYRARHVELNTEHALKIILPELANNQRIVDLFRREASVLRTIRHDAVVAYDGVSRDENGRLYLVMEFADGPSLSKLMHERRLDADEVRQLRDRLADGLAMAHDKGVVHRDISPDNVILPGGDLGKAKIIDFGISKAVDPEVKTIIGDDFAGKFSYVSPEQLGMFGGQIDGRSDIYSLGLVLAAAALGEPLDMGQSPISVIEARRSVPDLSRVPAAVRADLAAMLQPDPAKRPQSMREMIRPQDQRGGRRSTSSDAARPSAATKQRSGRIGVAAGALAVLVIAGGALGYWYWKGRPEPDHTSGTAQQADNGVQQGGTNGASNAGAADTSSGAVQGTQQSTTATAANQTQTSVPATSAESTGAGATGTQQQGAATGTTSSSAGTVAADGGQASASNATPPASSGDQSGAASSDGTAAGAVTGPSQSQQDNASAVTVPTGTGQTAAGTASSSQQQVSNGSASIVTPPANGQQSSATAATTVTGDQSATKTSTAADTAPSTTATQAADTATSNAAGATNSAGASGAGTAVTDTQTALLPQVPDVEKLRSQAQKAVGSLACAGVLVDVSAQGDIAASGFVGSEADRAQAAAALAALPQVGRVDNAIEVQTPPLCEVLGVLQGAALDIGGPSAPRIDPGGPYHEGKDPLNLTVTPRRDGYLYVDYIDAANEDPKQRYVLHLLPSPLRDPNNHVKAGAPVVIGSLPREQEIYRFNPPLGANMVLVILSPQPLFQKARPQEEDGDGVRTYLADLRTALTGVAKRAGPGKLFVGTSKLTFVTQ